MKILILLLLLKLVSSEMKEFKINENKVYISEWTQKKYTYLENSNITKLNINYFFGDDLYITYNVSNKKCSYNISNKRHQ